MKNKKWINKNLIKGYCTKVKSNITENRKLLQDVHDNISEESITTEKLEEAKNFQESKKKKGKKIWSILFLILNIALVALVFYNFANEQGGIQPLDTLINNSPKWYFLLIALGLYFATVILNALKFLILIYHRTKKIKFNFSMKMAVRPNQVVLPNRNNDQLLPFSY